MIKIVTVCGAGVGSSMMERLFAQQILDAEKLKSMRLILVRLIRIATTL